MRAAYGSHTSSARRSGGGHRFERHVSPIPDNCLRLVYSGGPGDEGLKSVGCCGELGSDPTFDASIEDIEREGTAGEDLIMEGLEVELGA